MPNHVMNKLEIKGYRPLLEACIKHISADTEYESNKFAFNNFLPMPKELLSIVKGARSINGKPVRLWREDSQGQPIEITEAEMTRLQVEYGHSDWYEWAVHSWGTKWDCYEVTDWEICRDPQAPEEANKAVATVYFNTAWAHPFPALTTLSEEWPALRLSVAYADEDIGRNCGAYEMQAGKVDSALRLGERAAVRFANEMWGYDD